MSIRIVCPSCRSSGKVPDAAAGHRVMCPQCKHVFELSASHPKATRARSAPTVLHEEDLELEPEPEPEPARPVAPVSPRSTAPDPSAATSPLLYAVLGIGGVCALLLMVVIGLLVAGRGGDAPPRPAGQLLAREEPVAPAPAVTPEPTSAPATTATSSGSPLSPSDSVARIKDATVFLKVKAGNIGGSGTGFVIRITSPNTALIATNRHVAMPHLDDGAADTPGPKPEITAVFRSGQGPGLEEALPAEIVAVDLADEMNHDLALLQVRGLSRPVTPIAVDVIATPSLTMKYTAFGFPYSQMTNFNRGNPSITVTGGSISGLRTDDVGQLYALQLDGSLLPGNSGGPIVDERGRLIGVSVAKLAMADTVGLAVPAAELRELLAGRVGALGLTVRPGQSDQVSLQVKAQVIDPDSRVRAVQLLVVPAKGTEPPARRSDGSWAPLTGATPIDLTLSRSVATGQVRIAVGPPGSQPQRFLVQTALIDSTGRAFHSTPRLYDPTDRKDKIAKIKRKLARRSLDQLGKLLEDDDPKTPDMCQLMKDVNQHKVTIALPAGVYSLSPHMTTKQKKPLHNAPRALAEVEGDFLAGVQVSGDMNPGLDPAAKPSGGKLPFCFQGAGLLLYQDKDNYVRLERACQSQGAALVRELLVEVVRGGREIDYHYIALPGDPAAPLDLFLIRKEGRVKCLFSHDGRRLLAFRDFALDYSPKVKIGLTASNLSQKPFTAQYDSFILLDEKLMHEEGLAE